VFSVEGMNERAPYDPLSDDRARPDRGRSLVLAAAIVVGMFVCYRLMVPFVPALAWALALAVLFAPMHRWTEARLHRPNVSASISVLIVGLIVVVPALFVGERLLDEATNGASAARATLESGAWQRAIEAHPTLAPAGRWMWQQLDVQTAVASVTAWLATTSASFVRGSVTQVIGLLLTFYLLFYFLRDRRAALRWLAALSPLSETETSGLARRIVDTVHATMYGTVACAAVQGVLGGLMFWWLDLPAPLLWGVVMGLLAVVPVLGAFIVWIPTAIALALNGNWGGALILALWGMLVVGMIDNLLYPILIGNRLKLHSVPSFIAVVGGLILFGTSGLILGPLAITITLALIDIWRGRTPTMLDWPLSERDPIETAGLDALLSMQKHAR
jgi:predicted PurR-regulated permease PerM